MKTEKLRLFLAGIVAFIWWFFFYPELCFPEDTYAVVYQGETYDMETWQELYPDIYEQLLQTDEEQIIVKSRLLEYWQQSKN